MQFIPASSSRLIGIEFRREKMVQFIPASSSRLTGIEIRPRQRIQQPRSKSEIPL
jgi:hypothetical protein